MSWTGADFETVEVPLNEQQRQVYDRGVHWWSQCKQDLQEALKTVAVGNDSSVGGGGTIWRTFWAAHQRFFKELAIW